MLPTRDPPQNKRPTQTESEGLETNIPSKWTGKKSQDSNTHIGQNRLQKKRAIKRDPEGYFIVLKERIHQHMDIVNIYAPNIGAPKYIRKNPGGLQERYKQ